MSLRLERLLAMNAAVRGGGYPSVPVFMRRFEVSERTAIIMSTISRPLPCHVGIVTVSVTAFAYNRHKPREKTAGFAVLTCYPRVMTNGGAHDPNRLRLRAA